MEFFRLMVHVEQVEESRKRKHTRVGNRSRQAEKNFSRKSNTEIRDNPRFKKGLDIPWFHAIINTFSLSLVCPKAFLC